MTNQRATAAEGSNFLSRIRKSARLLSVAGAHHFARDGKQTRRLIVAHINGETMNTATLTAASLTEYDFIAVIDASGSMATEDMKGRSRWAHMQETAEVFCRDLQKLDSDGIGLVVFSGQGIDSYDGVTVDKVTEVFQTRRPIGSTPLAEALTAALKLAGKSSKKDFIIVFTDGVPDDKDAAARVIVEASKKQESDDDLTILFVQVGYDKGASNYLRMLDDNLRGAKFDIVDAKTIEEAEKFSSTAELILAAIDD